MSTTPTPAPSHPGTVTQVSPLLVRPLGSSTSQPAKHLAAYSPVLNDPVAYVMFDRRTLLVLGKVI